MKGLLAGHCLLEWAQITLALILQEQLLLLQEKDTHYSLGILYCKARSSSQRETGKWNGGTL